MGGAPPRDLASGDTVAAVTEAASRSETTAHAVLPTLGERPVDREGAMTETPVDYEELYLALVEAMARDECEEWEFELVLAGDEPHVGAVRAVDG